MITIEDINMKNNYTYETDSIYCNREFLNLPHHGSSASVIASASIEKTLKDGVLNHQYPEISLLFSDCTRTITLDIGVSNREYENAIYKLDTIINVVQGLKDALPKLKELDDKYKKEIELIEQMKKDKKDEK